jgi:enoyl-CoA hydratase/carnithine racemase
MEGRVSDAAVRAERRESIGVLTISQPERLNAMRRRMWDDLPRVLATLASDPGVRAIVVRGEGTEAFSAGADISEFPENRTTVEAAERYSASVSAALDAVARTRTPTIAMVHGACAGGGAGIALSCGLRFADDRLRFSIPAARLGVVYEAEAIAALVHAVGESSAFDILVSGRTVTAAEALRIGLVNAVLPPDDLEAHTLAYAARVARNAPIPTEGAWVAIRAAREPGNDAWLRELARLQRAAIESADFAEGIAAFLEKRPPSFGGS